MRVFLINFQGTREISSIYRGIHDMPCSLYPSSTVYIMQKKKKLKILMYIYYLDFLVFVCANIIVEKQT